MGSRFEENPIGGTWTKPTLLKKFHPMSNITGKKIVSKGIGEAVKKIELGNKSLLLKRSIPIEHMRAKKVALAKKVVAVEKIAIVKKPGVSTKITNKINKSEPVKKVSSVGAEPPKITIAVKTVVPVDNVKVEKNKSVPATKTDVTIPSSKDLPKDEKNKQLQTTECKTSSSAETQETGHENKISELNVDKGQLNIQNSLYVKISFTDRPPKGTLTEFINKYNLESFKRIDNGVNVFAAKLKTVNDFKCICNAKEIYCGDVKVTVKPCYKYTSLMPKSKTNSNDKDNLSKCKGNREEENALIENAKKKEMSKEIDEGKSTIKSENQTEDTSLKSYKEDINLEHRANASNASHLEPDNNSKETSKDIKLVINVNVKKVANTCNVNITKDDSSIKKNIENRSRSVNTNNLQTTSKSVIQDITESKATTVNITHGERKIIKNYQKNSKSVFNKQVSKNTIEGDVELNDRNVLALITEGIVLDECCDSD